MPQPMDPRMQQYPPQPSAPEMQETYPIYDAKGGNTRFKSNESNYINQGVGKTYGSATSLLGFGGFLSSKPFLQWGTTPLMDYNLPAALKDRKNSADYIRAGHHTDASAGASGGRQNLRGRYMQKFSHPVRLRDLIAAEYAMSRIDMGSRTPAHTRITKVSSPVGSRAEVPTVLANTRFSLVIEAIARKTHEDSPGHRKESMAGVLRAAAKKTTQKAGKKTTQKAGKEPPQSFLNWLGRRTAMIGVGVPVAAVGLKGVDSLAGRMTDLHNERQLDPRFEGALQVAMQDGDVRNQVIDPITGKENKALIGRLRTQYGLLNKYAPRVTKDPILGASYLEGMAYRNAAGGSAREFADTTKSYMDLDRVIKGQRSHLEHPTMGSAMGGW